MSTVPTVRDTPDRDRILAMAVAAATLPEQHRRQAIMGLMRERYRSILSAADPRTGGLPCTEGEVFYAGYGDAAGREYWSAWLFPGKATADQLAWLIATHASCSAEEFERVRKQLAAGLEAALDKPARAMVEHLIADPDTACFISDGLKKVMGHVNQAPRSGAPGRPSSMHLVEQELHRRAAAGQCCSTVTEEAEHLESWFREIHPTAQPATAKTIRNRISPIYRLLIASRPKL